MDAATRAAVRDRAGDHCEYCLRSQIDSPLIALQIEHILPRKHGGNDDQDNLALACAECNLHKGSNLTGIDPTSNQITPCQFPRPTLMSEKAIQGLNGFLVWPVDWRMESGTQRTRR